MRQFVNPMNLSFRGDREEFDFLYFKVENTSQRCNDVSLNTQAGNGEFYGPDSMCAMSSLSEDDMDHELLPMCYAMSCDIDNYLTIHVGSQIRHCEHEGELLRFDGFSGFLVCPKPEYICGMKSFLGESPKPRFPTKTRVPATDVQSAFVPTETATALQTVSYSPSHTLARVSDNLVELSPAPSLTRLLLPAILISSLFFLGILACTRCIPIRTTVLEHALGGNTTRAPEPRLDIPIPDEP